MFAKEIFVVTKQLMDSLQISALAGDIRQIIGECYRRRTSYMA
jgi:hypothetical protein